MGLIAAAAELQGREHIVWLFEGEPSWPPNCACCLKPQPTRRIGLDKPASTAYPVCSACGGHGWREPVALVFAISAGLAAAAVIFSWLEFEMDGEVLLTLGAVLGLGVRWALTPLLGKTGKCADSIWPVDLFYLPNDTERRELKLWCDEIKRRLKPVLCLKFSNPDYAHKFIVANGGHPADIARIDKEK